MPAVQATSVSPRSVVDSLSNETLTISVTDKNHSPIVNYLGPQILPDLISITVLLVKAYSLSSLSSKENLDSTHSFSLLFFSSHSLLWLCKALLPLFFVSIMNVLEIYVMILSSVPRLSSFLEKFRRGFYQVMDSIGFVLSLELVFVLPE
jgi:hypothetical protein